MYAISCITDGTEHVLHNSFASVINPVITEYAGNTPNELTFSIPYNHAEWQNVQPFKSICKVYDNGVEIYSGRITDCTEDMARTKSVTCEGELGFLYDSIQRPFLFNGYLVEYIDNLLKSHNAQVDDIRNIATGDVTIGAYGGDKISIENTGYTPTLNLLADIVSMYGGYLRIRTEDEQMYLDYVDSVGKNSQEIVYGKNILDFAQNRNINDFFTCLIPTGADTETGTTTIAKINGGQDYIYNPEAVAEYGWIFRHEEWKDISDPALLMEKAKERLAKVLYMGTSMSLSAIDLVDLGVDADRLKTGAEVTVRSLAHNVDAVYVIEQRTKNLADPGRDTFALGEPQKSLSDYSVSVKTGASHDNQNLNASDIKGGNLVLGGRSCNKHGAIIIKDKDDNVIGRWSQDGFEMSRGVINMLHDEDIGLYCDGDTFRLGDFWVEKSYGRQTLQSVDETTGMSGEPDESGKYYLWAGWGKSSHGDTIFGVTNDRRVWVNGELMIDGMTLEEYIRKYAPSGGDD